LVNHKRLHRALFKWRLQGFGLFSAERAIKETEKRLKVIREESEKQFALENANEVASMIRKHKEEMEALKKSHVSFSHTHVGIIYFTNIYSNISLSLMHEPYLHGEPCINVISPKLYTKLNICISLNNKPNLPMVVKTHTPHTHIDYCTCCDG
jgi:hypothetical protein